MAKKKKEAPKTEASLMGAPVPKVEFAPIPPPAPELPPQAGIGPDVDYAALESKIDMTLLKAGVTEKPPPSASMNKETTKEISTAGMTNTDPQAIFTRTPPVKSETKSMSHSGTIKTRY